MTDWNQIAQQLETGQKPKAGGATNWNQIAQQLEGTVPLDRKKTAPIIDDPYVRPRPKDPYPIRPPRGPAQNPSIGSLVQGGFVDDPMTMAREVYSKALNVPLNKFGVEDGQLYYWDKSHNRVWVNKQDLASKFRKFVAEQPANLPSTILAVAGGAATPATLGGHTAATGCRAPITSHQQVQARQHLPGAVQRPRGPGTTRSSR